MKVFGIGFHKTGTSSLGEALRILGFGPVADHTPELLPYIREGSWETVKEYCGRFSSFEDNPWPLIYKELDRMFPGSKFVLTTRPEDDWIRSVVKHFGGSVTEMRKWIYGDAHGAPRGSEGIYLDRYRRHNLEVVEYFSQRPDDLILMKMSEGDGWEPLCQGLRCSVPREPFPHANRAAQRTLSGRLFIRLGLTKE